MYQFCLVLTVQFYCYYNVCIFFALVKVYLNDDCRSTRSFFAITKGGTNYSSGTSAKLHILILFISVNWYFQIKLKIDSNLDNHYGMFIEVIYIFCF